MQKLAPRILNCQINKIYKQSKTKRPAFIIQYINGQINDTKNCKKFVFGSGYLYGPIQLSASFLLLSLCTLPVLQEHDKVIKLTKETNVLRPVKIATSIFLHSTTTTDVWYCNSSSCQVHSNDTIALPSLKYIPGTSTATKIKTT